MKRCPTYQQTYPDETLQFCRVDGALLVSDSPEAEVTRVLSESRATGEAPTEGSRKISRSIPTIQRTIRSIRCSIRCAPIRASRNWFDVSDCRSSLKVRCLVSALMESEEKVRD